jgi:OOP family OmpA-OmpF porin
MFTLVTVQYYATRGARAAACALALGLVCGAPLAQPQPQSLLGEKPSTWQSPPSLTLPAAAPASPTRHVPEAAIEKITLDAGALFEFDAYELRPVGRVALDEFIGRLAGATFAMIRAVGHADRLGSEAHNQILSEERAEAVKAYLVGKGVEPGRVQAEGRGASQPVTKPGECAGGKSAEVIACLQPDRRVEIEVAGTRPSTHSGAGPAFDRN